MRSLWLIQGNKHKVSAKSPGGYTGYFKTSVAAATIDDAIAVARKHHPGCEILHVQNQGAIEHWED